MSAIPEVVPQTQEEPDEQSGINLRSFVKIYDPETEEVFVTNND